MKSIINRHIIILWVFISFIASGCGGARETESVLTLSTEVRSSHPQPRLPDVHIQAAEAGGYYFKSLADYLSYPDRDTRGKLALALGRIGDPAALPLLLSLLSDDDPFVRQGAAFGIGMLNFTEATNVTEELITRCEAETDDVVVAQLLRTIGTLGGPENVVNLARYTNTESTPVRIACLEALGHLASNGNILSTDILRSVVDDPLASQDESLQIAGSFILWAASGNTGLSFFEPSNQRELLNRDILGVRRFSALALAQSKEMTLDIWKGMVTSGDGENMLLAIHVLPHLVYLSRCDTAQIGLSEAITLLESAKEPKDELWYTGLYRLSLAVSGCAQGAHSRRLGQRLYESIKPLLNTHNPIHLGNLKCVAALLSEQDSVGLVACDGDRPWVGKQLLIRRLRTKSVRSEQDESLLIDMMRDSDLRVAAHAIDAVASLHTKKAQDALYEIIVNGDVHGVVMGLDGLFRNIGDHSTIENGNSIYGTPGLLTVLDDVLNRFNGFSHVQEPIVETVRILSVLSNERAAAMLLSLVGDSRPYVRAAVLQAIRRNGAVELPPVLPPTRAPESTVQVEPGISSQLPSHVRINTSFGEVRILLFDHVAPRTVGDFTGHVRDTYYDGHDILESSDPYLIHFGDVTGTGFGGTEPLITDEKGPISVERGTVALYQSRQHGNGARFFISRVARPDLYGKYNVFGKVVSDMGVIDKLASGGHVFSIENEFSE